MNESVDLQSWLKKLSEKVDKILACLMGDIGQEKCGLLEQHRQRGKEFEEMKGKMDDHEKRIADLENYKRDTIAWAAGAAFVVVVGWELARAFVFQ
jgi:hypothetical protein